MVSLTEIELQKQLDSLIDRCEYRKAYELALAHKAQRHEYTPSTLLLMFNVFLQFGDLPQAVATKNEAMTSRVDGGIDNKTISEFQLLAGMYYIAVDDLVRAQQELTEARRGFKWLPSDTQGRIHLVTAHYNLARGRVEEARAELDTAEALFVFETSESLVGRELTWLELLIGVASGYGRHELSGPCYRIINTDPDSFRRRTAKSLVSWRPSSRARAIASLSAH